MPEVSHSPMSTTAPSSPAPSASTQATPGTDADGWKALVAAYQEPHLGRAVFQVVTTYGAYFGAWVAMWFALQVSIWLALPIAVVAAGLMIRMFILLHDCGHGSYFASKTANRILGAVTGLFTFTPYDHWRKEHAQHHRNAGDLDRRGVGDMWTMTVEEYLSASRWRRFAYRLSRNPLILFVIAPAGLMLVFQRFPSSWATGPERRSVLWTNLGLLAYAGGMSLVFGIGPFLILQATTLAIAASVGVWLFYVQHQFEDVYWERGESWDFRDAALRGSSYLKLPRILQWFTGNIGFHHLHHLSPRIPNYYLEECHRSDPLFTAVKPVTIRSSLSALGMRLWDESSRRLVGDRELRQIRRGARSQAIPRS